MKNLLGAMLIAMALSPTATTVAHGQAISTNGGSVQGTITDPTGAAIPNATVAIKNSEIGYTHTVQTDRAGFYSVGPLVPGNYQILITAPNFENLSVKTVVRTGTVTSGSEKLTLGNANETIEVNAGALQINTDQIGVAGVINTQQIDTLPVNGRNILDVAQLQPGVVLQTGETFDPTKAGYSAISVDGVGGRTTRILLDGQDITDETVGTTLFNVPSGPIGELQLNRSTQDVSGEVTSTGQVLVSTRSGTNTLHGNVFYNFQDNHAGFANVNGVDAPFQRNQFGGYIGGALIKDKLFFFGGGERILQHEQDAAQSPNPLFNNITAQYPLVPAPFKDTYSTVRLDYNAPRGIHLFVRGLYSVNYDVATFGFVPYSFYSNRDNTPGIVGGADMTTGRFTHSFRVGYEKFHNILGDATATAGSSTYNPSTGPNNQVTLYGSFFAGPNYLAPQQTYQSDKQFRYDGTWTKGSHSIKFGFEMNRILNGGFAEFYGASLFTDIAAVPSLQATNCGDVANAAACPNDPYNGYVADEYILGNGNSLFSERPGFGLVGGGDPSWRFAAYVADTWKVTPSFTVTAGLRWSVDTDRANQDLSTPLCGTSVYAIPNCTGNQPLFNFYGSVAGSGGAYGPIGFKTRQPYGNFGPQLGFVFSPGAHKTSVRAGIGIYYENDIFNNTGNSRTESIQANGAYFNYGVLQEGGTSIYLPGLGSVTGITSAGVPCTGGAGCTAIGTISTESINQAAPQLNALKSYYQSQVKGSVTANPAYIGNGGGLFANNIYAGPYKTPYSVQFSGGMQHDLGHGIIVSADYIHNSTLKIPLSVDVNSDGAARTLNLAAAQNAVATTLAPNPQTGYAGYPMCPQGYSAAAINCAIQNGASISSFASNGLDSGSTVFGGASASAYGATPSTGAAFPGINPNVGEGLFILPIGRSGYDAAEFVLQQQKVNPFPGIRNSNFQISYALSRIVSSTGVPNQSSENVSDQFFAGGRPWNNDNPNQYMGRNNLDRSNELSFGGSIGIKYGLQLGVIGHFFSAPPASPVLDATTGATGQIFTTDVNGDGTYGDLLPGTNPGYYMHQVKGTASLNRLINNYNSSQAGTPTPAGQALVAAGLFTTGQLSALGGVQQPLATAPSNALLNAATRTFDMNASYPITLRRFREGLSIVPGVAFYNLFNMSNFAPFGGVLLNTADAGTPGYLNGPSNQSVLNSNRVERASGTFDQGGPRTTEFQLKVNF